jgi:hypothetical protein
VRVVSDDEVYVDELGRRRLGREARKTEPAPRRGEYVSPIWPPPGSAAAAHRPECGRDGRGCVCDVPAGAIPFRRRR